MFLTQKGTSIGHFGARDYPIIKMRKNIEKIAVEAIEVAEADEVNEAAEVRKSLMMTLESSRLLNSAYFDVFLMFKK